MPYTPGPRGPSQEAASWLSLAVAGGGPSWPNAMQKRLDDCHHCLRVLTSVQLCSSIVSGGREGERKGGRRSRSAAAAASEASEAFMSSSSSNGTGSCTAHGGAATILKAISSVIAMC